MTWYYVRRARAQKELRAALAAQADHSATG
jgi:hypothetical protein